MQIKKCDFFSFSYFLPKTECVQNKSAITFGSELRILHSVDQQQHYINWILNSFGALFQLNFVWLHFGINWNLCGGCIACSDNIWIERSEEKSTKNWRHKSKNVNSTASDNIEKAARQFIHIPSLLDRHRINIGYGIQNWNVSIRSVDRSPPFCFPLDAGIQWNCFVCDLMNFFFVFGKDTFRCLPNAICIESRQRSST